MGEIEQVRSVANSSVHTQSTWEPAPQPAQQIIARQEDRLPDIPIWGAGGGVGEMESFEFLCKNILVFNVGINSIIKHNVPIKTSVNDMWPVGCLISTFPLKGQMTNRR